MKAIENYEKALKIQKEVLPENHPDIASSYSNIGTALNGLSEWDKAIESYNQALAILKKALPENHPDIANCYIHIGDTYNSMEQPEKAKQYYAKAGIFQVSCSGKDPCATCYVQ